MPKTTDTPPEPPATSEAGQATTAEEAMDALSEADGHVDESAYAPTENPEE